jgi:hypothetical protein
MKDNVEPNRRKILYTVALLPFSGCLNKEGDQHTDNNTDNDDSTQRPGSSDDDESDEDDPPERNERIALTAFIVDPDSAASDCVSPEDPSL